MWQEYVYEALRETPDRLTWQKNPDGTYEFTDWNEAVRGPLDMAAVQALAEVTMNGALASKPPLPDLTPRQFRLALLTINVSEAMVDGMIAQLPAEEVAQATIEWKYSDRIERAHPLVDSIGVAMGHSPSEIDAIWAWAAGV